MSKLHELGRIPLTSDSNSVDIIDNTDESEDDDLSDSESGVNVSSNRRGVRRVQTAPARDRNLMSGSARFRRTSSRPTSAMWQSRGEANVDQSVNIMDSSAYDPEAGSSRGARPAANIRQKSLVDIFLSDENTRGSVKSRGSGKDSPTSGKMDYGVTDMSGNTGGNHKCRTGCLVAMVFVIVVALIVVVPPFGLLASSNSGDDNIKQTTHAPHTIKPPVHEEHHFSHKKTPAPERSPGSEELMDVAEVEIEEEVEVSPPQKEDGTEEEEFILNGVPQDSRIHALEFYVMDQDVTTQEQLDLMGSPSKKALHWISQKDPAMYAIPGLEPVLTSNEVAVHALLQRYALAVFYFSMQAASSTHEEGQGQKRMLAKKQNSQEELANRKEFDNNWLNVEPVCQWHGVTCDEDFKKVIRIDLSGHLLQGTVPRELLVGGAMPYLKQLHLGSNQMQGNLPNVARRSHAGWALEVIPPASGLEALDLSNNQLTGSLDNLMGLTKLKKLDLSRNKLTGKIPKAIRHLLLLEDLTLSDNHLTGAAPAENLAQLMALKYLRLVGNALSEDLPTTLSALTNLQELRLSSNQFVGKIPISYGDLVNLNLLHMDGNDIQGKVPTNLGQLTRLRDLQLDGNALTGDMPREICELRDGSLSRLQTDCADGEIVCKCCTECY